MRTPNSLVAILSRIWSIRINLDALRDHLTACRTDSDRLQVYQGMMWGAGGMPYQDDDHPLFVAGWNVGVEGFEQAEKHRSNGSKGGSNSAKNRRKRIGTAQPISRSPLRENPKPTSENVEAND